MQELTEYGIGDWKGIILTEFNTWRNNAEDPMTDSEKSTMHNTILNSLYSNDPKANSLSRFFTFFGKTLFFLI